MTAAVLTALLLTTGVVHADDPPDAPQSPANPDRDTPGPGVVPAAVPDKLDRLDRQVLNAFGLRPWLADRGLTYDASLTADFSKSLRGPATGSDVFRHLFDFRVSLDTEKLHAWPGGTLSVDFQNQAGRNGSDLYGDVQGYDNVDTDGRTQISELWYEQTVGDPLRLKVGKIDATTEFVSPEYASQFLSSSFGYSPTITGLPTYPDPSVGLCLFVQPTDWLDVAYGVFDDGDGEPTGDHPPHTLWRGDDGLFQILELDGRWKLANDTLPGRLAVGVSFDSGTQPGFDGADRHPRPSAYAVVEQKLYQSDSAKPQRGVYAFGQFGLGDPRVDAVHDHVGLGVTWVGPYAAEYADSLGVGVTCAVLSDATGSPYAGRTETSVEAYYNFQATSYLSIKPNLQYVIHPAGDAARPDALIATLRVTVAF